MRPFVAGVPVSFEGTRSAREVEVRSTAEPCLDVGHRLYLGVLTFFFEPGNQIKRERSALNLIRFLFVCITREQI